MSARSIDGLPESDLRSRRVSVSRKRKRAERPPNEITSASDPRPGSDPDSPVQNRRPLVTRNLGLIVRWKSIRHRWLARRPPCALIAIVDESTGRAVARLAPSESRYENMLLLRSYLETWGCPAQIQTDPDALFTERSREQARSQIGRALLELDIRWFEVDRARLEGHAERFSISPRRCCARDSLARG